MKRARILFAAAALLCSGGVRTGLKPASQASETDARASAAAAVQGPRLSSLLEQWAKHHEAGGGDRAIEIALSAVGTESAHRAPAAAAPAGLVRLDAIGGRVQVELAATGAAAPYDVWLVDQRPGPGSSAALEPSDAYLRAGTLQAAAARGGVLRLQAELGAAAFEHFQVDDVVIARSGENPAQAAAYRGAPDLFQSLYTSLRTPALFARSDYASPDAFGSRREPLIGVSEARAQSLEELRGFGLTEDVRRQLLAVDADAVANELVRMGAQLFIQETFAGNGRTCETCHSFLNNISLDRNDVALRPDRDALFVSEFMPALAPRRVGGQMRFALDAPTAVRDARPCVTVDGFPKLDGSAGDPEPVCRAVPHLQAFALSRAPVAPALLLQGTALGGGPLPQFSALFPGGPDQVPADGSKPGQLGSEVLADAEGELGFAIDQSFSVGLRAGFGGDRGVEPALGLFGDDIGIVIGAVAELFTRTTARDPRSLTPDFRVPTPAEVNAITAFYLTLGRQQEPNVERLRMSDPQAERGRLIFLNDGRAEVLDRAGQPVAAGKCAACHFNLGSGANPTLFDPLCTMAFTQLRQGTAGNAPSCGRTQLNFETGAENNTTVAQSETLLAFNRMLPRDGGYGRVPHVDGVCSGGKGGKGAVALIAIAGTGTNSGDCQELFNPPVLVEAADTGPFFHNNSATTLEDAIGFYASNVFNRSAAGRMLAALTPTAPGDPRQPIDLNAGDAAQLAAFLRAVNAANNALRARDLVVAARRGRTELSVQRQLLRVARAEVQDAIDALRAGQVNAPQMANLVDLQALLTLQLGDAAPVPADLSRIQQDLNRTADDIVSGFPDR